MGLFNYITRSYLLSTLQAQVNFIGHYEPPGDETELTENLYCSSFYLPAGLLFYPRGFHIICLGDFINDGEIFAVGHNGYEGTITEGGAAGAWASIGPLLPPTVGGAGGNPNQNGNNAASSSYHFGSIGGAGGNAGANTGGTVGTLSNPFYRLSLQRTINYQLNPYAIINGLTGAGTGSGSGGGGASNAADGSGGGGGQGGLNQVIIATRIFNNNTISVRGGNGGGGGGAFGSQTGGGGGGGGGNLFLVSNFLDPGTVVISGGTGGVGRDGGLNGSNGSSGTSLYIPLT